MTSRRVVVAVVFLATTRLAMSVAHGGDGGPSPPISAQPVGLTLSDRPIEPSDRVVVEADPLALELVDRGDGAPAARVHIGIVSSLADRATGAQSWSLAISVGGGIVPVAATVDGTLAASVDADPPGIVSSGFNVVALVNPERPDPETQEPQGHGVVSGVIVSWDAPVWLPRVGTAEVLRVDVEAAGVPGEPVAGRVWFRDGLSGHGQPVDNRVVVEGVTLPFVPQREALVVGVVEPPEELSRCDANGDGRHDLADAVWIVNALFRAGPAIECADAGDCDDDGRLALSDAVYAAAHQFLRGPEPPPPFVGCGADPTDDELGCERPGACP